MLPHARQLHSMATFCRESLLLGVRLMSMLYLDVEPEPKSTKLCAPVDHVSEGAVDIGGLKRPELLLTKVLMCKSFLGMASILRDNRNHPLA